MFDRPLPEILLPQEVSSLMVGWLVFLSRYSSLLLPEHLLIHFCLPQFVYIPSVCHICDVSLCKIKVAAVTAAADEAAVAAAWPMFLCLTTLVTLLSIYWPTQAATQPRLPFSIYLSI